MEHAADEQGGLGCHRHRLAEPGQALRGAVRRLVVLAGGEHLQQPRHGVLVVAPAQRAVDAGELEPPPAIGGQRPAVELPQQAAVAAGVEGVDQKLGRRIGQRARRAGRQHAGEEAGGDLGVTLGQPVSGQPEPAVGA